MYRHSGTNKRVLFAPCAQAMEQQAAWRRTLVELRKSTPGTRRPLPFQLVEHLRHALVPIRGALKLVRAAAC